MKKQKNKTLILTFSGIAVFVIGAILGSFLVLRSHTGEGKEFYIKKNTNAEDIAQEDRQSLITQLRGSLIQRGNIPANINLTDEMLLFLLSESQTQDTSFNELGKSESFLAAVEGTIEKYKFTLPEIDDEKINISATANEIDYLTAINEKRITLSKAWKTVVNITPENFQDQNVAFVARSKELSILQSELQKIEVPTTLVSFHKEQLKFTVGLRTLIEGALFAEKDPLRFLIQIENFEKLAELGREIDSDYLELVKKFDQ